MAIHRYRGPNCHISSILGLYFSKYFRPTCLLCGMHISIHNRNSNVIALVYVGNMHSMLEIFIHEIFEKSLSHCSL